MTLFQPPASAIISLFKRGDEIVDDDDISCLDLDKQIPAKSPEQPSVICNL